MIRTLLATATLLVSLVTSAPAAVLAHTQESKPQSVATPLNLNTATQSDLEKLPGVGPATAKQIIEYRQKNNGFKKVEELMNIKGIGEKSFLKLKPLVTIAPAKLQER